MIKFLTSTCLALCLPLAAETQREPLLKIEESLFIRRIAEFWEEGEVHIAKTQIAEFLDTFPESAFADPLRASLGDLLFREGEYTGALNIYAKITSPEFQNKAFFNRMQALYRLEWYTSLIDACEAALTELTDPIQRKQANHYLAAALYQQCCACEDAERKKSLAQKAIPSFETLVQDEMSPDAFLALAHLNTLIQNHAKAEEIYRALSSQESPLTPEVFSDPDTLYRHLAIAFEVGRYQEIFDRREAILASLSEETRSKAALFIGQSALLLKQYPEAISVLRIASLEKETEQKAFASLLEAAHEASHLLLVQEILEEIASKPSLSCLISRGSFIKILILKKEGKFEEARQEITNFLSSDDDFPEKTLALLEQIQIESACGFWESCHAKAFAFLFQFPESAQAPFAWRALSLSSRELANKEAKWQEIFSADLEKLLEQKHLFSSEEVLDWQFCLAESYFKTERFQAAIPLLESLLKEDFSFSQRASGELLLGLCFQESSQDARAFYTHACKAAKLGCTLMAPKNLHIALFNASLSFGEEFLKQSAEHLYQALEAGASITEENLVWLGKTCLEQDKIEKIYSALLQNTSDPKHLETALYTLAKIARQKSEPETLPSLIDQLETLYRTDSPQIWDKEALFFCAQYYRDLKKDEKALAYLDHIADSKEPIRSEIAAKALLEKAKILASQGNLEERPTIATLFKTLVLQRNLAYEPIYLEAALFYIDLLADNAEKRLFLLEKMKKEFESLENIISQDYLRAREKYPEKNKIYEQYTQFFNAQILKEKAKLSTDPLIQASLQTEALVLWQKIQGETTVAELYHRMSLGSTQSADTPISQ